MSEEFERKVFEVEIDYHPETEAILTEYWRNQFGQFDRLADLPAVTEFCPVTGKTIYRRWHQGEFPSGPHRDGDKPARVTTDPNTDVDTQEDFFKLGRYHRDGDNPAEVFRYDDGTPEKYVYWQFGKKHRQPELGPAVIKFDKDGNVSEVEYWLNNRQVHPPSPANKLDI